MSLIRSLLTTPAKQRADWNGLGYPSGDPMGWMAALAPLLNQTWTSEKEVVEGDFPGLVRTAAVNVEIETEGLWTRGRTVADLRRVTGRAANAHVGLDIDRERFVRILVDAIRSYD